MILASAFCVELRGTSCNEPRGDVGGVPLLGSESKQRVHDKMVASILHSKMVWSISGGKGGKHALKTTLYVRAICEDTGTIIVIGLDLSSNASPLH